MNATASQKQTERMVRMYGVSAIPMQMATHATMMFVSIAATTCRFVTRGQELYVL